MRRFVAVGEGEGFATAHAGRAIVEGRRFVTRPSVGVTNNLSAVVPN